MPSTFEERLACLLAEEQLPPAYRDIVERVWRPLAERLAAQHRGQGKPILIGVNGAQGSGKTTMCRFLDELLLPELGLRSAVFSLDDLYLTHAERLRLAREIHPLLVTRGVPGTHDVAMGIELIGKLLGGQVPVQLPRFDKSRDDRAAASHGSVIDEPPDVVLFEGWCIGAEPQVEEALAEPVNALERQEDADAGWRRYANQALAGPYRTLFGGIDLLVMLRPPDFETVIANRRLQEEKLGARAGAGNRVMDDAELDRFLQHYERLTRHMLATLPARADVLIDVDAPRNVTVARM